MGSGKPVVLFAAALFASACFVFAFEGLLGPGAALLYAAALVSGVLSGLSGNPLWYSLPAAILIKFGNPGGIAALFPAELINKYLKPEASLLFIAIIMAVVSFYDVVKKRRVKYESAFLLPATALPVMCLAIQMRESAAPFYDLFKGVFAGPLPIGFIAAATLLLGIAKWAARTDPGSGRHWSWNIAAGLIIGFWFGYLEYSWAVSLIALLYFSYLFILNEDGTGIIYCLPLAAIPLITGKIVLSKTAVSAFQASAGPIPWALVIITVAGFSAACLFGTRLMSALPAGLRRALFFVTLFVFLFSILFRV
jgi:hypothetical protein